MDFVGYEEIPVLDNNGLVIYYQLAIIWKEESI